MSWWIVHEIKKRMAVPTADVTTNVNERDAVGNKTDAAVTTVGTTKSLMAHIKGIMGFHTIAVADATTNAQMRDSIGNKEDAAVDDVGTTKTIMAYIKGAIQELDQRKTAKMAYATTTAATAQDVLNITDKGVLTGITIITTYISAQNYIHFIITIDGVVVMNTTTTGQFLSSPTAALGSVHFSFNHRFNTSLRVQHWENSAGQFTLDTFVTYTTDN